MLTMLNNAIGIVENYTRILVSLWTVSMHHISSFTVVAEINQDNVGVLEAIPYNRDIHTRVTHCLTTEV